MLTIYFGDDISKSRSEFLAMHDSIPGAQRFDGRDLTITELMQIFDGGGLFEETKSVFIQNFITQRKEGKELAIIREYLLQKAAMHTIYIWESKDLTKVQLAKLGKATTRSYKLPQSLFQFLESIKPQNSVRAILLFRQTILTNEPEMIFFMLVRHIRILIALRLNDTIEETKRIADWQRTKLATQARSFDIVQLRNMYQRLSDIDVKMKTGNLGASMDTAIDMLLLEL